MTPTRQLATDIGRALTAARGERSLRDVAGALGWSSHRNLLSIEGGDRNPTLDRLEEWAAAYGGRLNFCFVDAGGGLIEAACPAGVVDRRLAAQVGAVLAAARQATDTTQRSVAEGLDRVRLRRGSGDRPGVASNYLVRIEAGKDNPTVARLEALAEAYGGWLGVTFVQESVSPAGTSS